MARLNNLCINNNLLTYISRCFAYNLVSVFLGFLLYGTHISSISAESRSALIIGNGNYHYVPTLKNPVNDATDISVVLKKLRFDVDLVTNASKKEIEKAVKNSYPRLV